MLLMQIERVENDVSSSYWTTISIKSQYTCILLCRNSNQIQKLDKYGVYKMHGLYLGMVRMPIYICGFRKAREATLFVEEIATPMSYHIRVAGICMCVCFLAALVRVYHHITRAFSIPRWCYAPRYYVNVCCCDRSCTDTCPYMSASLS